MKTKIKFLTTVVSIAGCLMLTSCAQTIGTATFLSSKDVNFTYQTGAKGNMGIYGTGHTIDDAVKDALQKAGSNFDALIDVKIIRRQYYCILFDIVSYKVIGTPVNTTLIKTGFINDSQYSKFCLLHNYLKPNSI